ncbi:hypothetical protein [Arachidicoccus ginsenosidivorans]|nr:hypothetical protein [Arachidicoccus ginsenosidivorans]
MEILILIRTTRHNSEYYIQHTVKDFNNAYNNPNFIRDAATDFWL